ncbi:hypothetical protein WBS58_22160 [Bacillus albus]|uniref:hypothetical protein n=1 Tax=Bacillus albus TaxID=2026189 RepID=UPI0030148CE6
MTIGNTIDEYSNILIKTIISDYIHNNEEFKVEILQGAWKNNYPNEMTESIKNYIQPKQSIDLNSIDVFLNSFNSLYEEVNINNFKLLSLSEERAALKKQGVLQNQILNKEESNKLLTRIKRIYVDILECEIKKYDPETLLFTFYGIADRLAFFSNVILYKLETNNTTHIPLIKDNPVSLLTVLISNTDLKNNIQISNQIGREKHLIDIIFNLVYKMYINQQQQESISYQEKIDIRRIYQLSYMVMKSNLLLKSNELLYEQNEFLKIVDWTFVQSGNFEEKMLSTRLDVVNFNYNSNIINQVFEQYSKREGFCPDDLLDFIRVSSSNNQAQIHLKTFNIEKLKHLILNLTNVKEYGVDRFLNVLTLKKDIKDIADSKNKISQRPFIELKDGLLLYADNITMLSSQVLGVRMLQQSFTLNKKLQKFISKNYDEAGIKDLVNSLIRVNLPHLEHVNIDKIKEKYIKNLINIKGITKEFDLIFSKNNVLYVVEYKTWKISSHNIIQVLNEQKKITNNIVSHKKAIEVINTYPKEFRNLFGEGFNNYNKIELIMVFQNPTAFKYLNI